ncbi:MAG: Ig-like domain-containing protein, partial [Candidatus Methanosuratincola petrocarbonis]
VRDAVSEVSQSGVVLRIDGTATSPALGAASPRGLWVNATAGALDDGWHTFTATVSDVLGNTAVVALRLAVDTTPPEVAGYLPLNGSYVG